MKNVPWDQALDIVLRTKGLDKRHDGNVIIVAPADELASREKADLAQGSVTVSDKLTRFNARDKLRHR